MEVADCIRLAQSALLVSTNLTMLCPHRWNVGPAKPQNVVEWRHRGRRLGEVSRHLQVVYGNPDVLFDACLCP